jgi:transcriptional antiterminator RfaH
LRYNAFRFGEITIVASITGVVANAGGYTLRLGLENQSSCLEEQIRAPSSLDFIAHNTQSLSRVGPRWYAVQCQPNRERAAAHHLAFQSFNVFLPCRERTRRHARRIETVRRPYFPGYLFVTLDMSKDRWRSINGTCGVVRIVSQGDRPAPAPRGVIEALKTACDDKDVLSWRPELKPGQSVRVVAGPFAEFIGEVDRLTDSERVFVLLELMGARIPVQLPRDYLAPATSYV